MIKIIVTLCHLGSCTPVPLGEIEGGPMTCMLIQPLIAEWKAHSVYASKDHTVLRVDCPNPNEENL
jgi:hypothetical protein